MGEEHGEMEEQSSKEDIELGYKRDNAKYGYTKRTDTSLIKMFIYII